MATRAAELDYPPTGQGPRVARPSLAVIEGGRQEATPARYGEGERFNAPVMAGIALAHAAVAALLLATGTVRLTEQPKPVAVRLMPQIEEPVAPPPPSDVQMEQVPVEVYAPPVAVDVPVPPQSPVQVTNVPPPPAVPAPSAPTVEVGPPVAAPVTPPDFRAAQLNNPGPRYPAMSRRWKEQGTAVLKVLVSPEGKAQELTVQNSSGFARLDDAALETVKRWKFVPAKQAGKAVTAWVLVPVTFALSA